MTKADKHMGLTSAAVQRRTDPVPERPTPKSTSKKAIKRFGFEVQYRGWGTGGKWRWQLRQWYETEKQRDQAMTHFLEKGPHRTMPKWYGEARPVDR